MRIILLSQHFPPETGAPQIRLYEVSRELLSRGHQVEVVTAFPHHPHGIIPEEYKGHFYMFEKHEGIPVHRSWIYPSPKGSFWKRLLSYFSFTFSAFYSLAKADRTDVIICTSPPLFLGITGYIGAKFKKAKFVFNVADIWPESAVKLGLVTNKHFINLAIKLEQFLYKKAWKIATATEGIKDYMIEHGKKKEDVFLLPNGVNSDTFRPMPRDKELVRNLDAEDKKIITYAGRIGYAQGLDAVLEAAKIVQEKDNSVHFLIVGDGPEKEKLEQLSAELGLTNTSFYGSVPLEQMPAIFSVSDFSIVSLRNLELFKGARPSKIFPALATGTPVLYCGAGESAKILETHNCGLIAEPENPKDISEKIFALTGVSETEYETLSQNGRKLAVEEFSWKKIVDDLMDNISKAESKNTRS